MIALTCSGMAVAQAIPPSTQFDINGFLQTATLDGNVSGALQGGHLTVNGHLITVPANTIVILPANALTWAELFSKAPAPWAGTGQTGMAKSDVDSAGNHPLTTYEVHVVGNRVPSAAGGDQYIAGMITFDQNALNTGAGYINFIDYDLGEMRVGGLMNDPLCTANAANTMAGGSGCSGTRVRLNDPMGRYGRVSSPDVRFTVDPDNPTIMSGTGYPMCLPRVSPSALAPDALCPEGNRPRTADPVTGLIIPSINFTTLNLTNPNFPIDAGFPNSTFQAPFEVGDYIIFAGNLMADCSTCVGGGSTVGPFVPGTTTTFIAAHTITNNTAIFTFQGSNPAYIMVDTSLIGTGGLTVLGATEAVIRTRFEGMMTDITRTVHLYGMDWSSSGAESDRDYGTIGVDPGPAGGVGAVQGRWRFRPPCLPFGTVATKPDKQCVMNQAGTFLPPPREMRAVIEGLQSQATAQTAGSTAPGVLAANGLYWGQYHAPIDEYIFPENVPGTAIVENNFNAVPFLACGGYSSSGIGLTPTTPVLAPGPLSPWPSNVPADLAACTGLVTPPSAVSATATPTVASSGTLVTLSATASGTAPVFAWTQTAGTAGTFTPNPPNGALVVWSPPVVTVAETATFQVTASNSTGSATATVNVSVNPPQPPTIVSATPSNSQVASNGTLTLNATATGAGPISFAWSQATGPAGTFTPNPPNGATVSWTAPPVSVLTAASFQVIATNAFGSSAPATVNITIDKVGAPVLQPIAAQSVITSSAVSIPVTATSPNTRAKLILAVTPTALTNFKINGPSQTCNTTGCTATWTVTFTAPASAQTINFSMTATDTSVTPNLSSAAQLTSVTVSPLPTPVVNPVAATTVLSGVAAAVPVTATSPSTTSNLTLQVTQTTTFTLTGLTVSGPSKTCTTTGCSFAFTLRFTRTLPAGQVTPDVVNFTITATDIARTPNLVSAPVAASVTVNPQPDIVTAIAPLQYRRNKQRLDLTATSSVVSANVILKLQPYQCQSGSAPCVLNTTTGAWMYDPTILGNTFTNTGGGNYTLSLVGAPEPACNIGGSAIDPCSAKPLDIKSNLNGDSGFVALTNVR